MFSAVVDDVAIRGAAASHRTCNSKGTHMKTISCAMALFYLLCGGAYALDGFDKVRCGSDIPTALMGQRPSHDTIAAIESRHKALKLKNLGADEIDDHLSSISWLICEQEFVLLEDDHLVRDVLPFPLHSKTSPAFSGTCRVNGRDVPEVIVAVLDNKPGLDMLPAATAWKIDEKNAKFVKMPAEGLLCPRSGIFTVDGGL
jgi:hypothetical protein